MIGRRVAAAISVLLIAGCGGSSEPAAVSVLASTTTALATGCRDVDFRARVGVYAAAQSGEVDGSVPATLGPAAASAPQGLFTGVLYGGCEAERVNGLGHELMMWTNGIGVLAVSWQEWPDDGPLQSLPFGGEDCGTSAAPPPGEGSWGCRRQAGVVEVAAMDYRQPDTPERTRIVHLHDGMKVVTVATYALTTLSLEQAEELAWGVYDALPVGPRSRPEVPQRTFAELLAAIPSDTLSVSGVEGADAMSPFTSSLAIPVVTRRFIAGGSTVTAFDFGAAGAADRAEAAVAADGYTIGWQPYDVVATPRFWRWDRIILHYMGDDPELLTRLVEVLGQPFAGPQIPQES